MTPAPQEQPGAGPGPGAASGTGTGTGFGFGHVPRLSEPLTVRTFRFSRALVVGGFATAGDFSVLTTLVRLVGVDPAWARAPALLTGACIQFLGNRSFTFRAQAGKLSRQARLFLLFESLTLGLNWLLYQGLLKALPAVAPELLSFLGTFIVFLGFNYPVRKNVIFTLP